MEQQIKDLSFYTRYVLSLLKLKFIQHKILIAMPSVTHSITNTPSMQDFCKKCFACTRAYLQDQDAAAGVTVT